MNIRIFIIGFTYFILCIQNFFPAVPNCTEYTKGRFRNLHIGYLCIQIKYTSLFNEKQSRFLKTFSKIIVFYLYFDSIYLRNNLAAIFMDPRVDSNSL